jgi:putative polyhydroxyalkanoate system protein
MALSQIHIERSHRLSREQAKSQIESIAGELQNEIGISYRWDDDRLLLKRQGASGTVQIQDDRIVLDIRLGILLSPLKGTIERVVNERLDEHLAGG